MNFKNKTVVITGASSGIGLALSREFASLGANVVMGARTEEALRSLVAEFESQGVRSLYRVTDITSEQACRELVEAAVEAFGGIDVCICNAGISMRALYDDVDMSVIHRLMDVNFWGTAYTVKYALPYIQKSHGSIVGVSSVAGFHGLPGRTGYSASKYAMHGLLETIRIENLKKGIHVMIAAPGFTASNVRFSALTADGSPQGASPRNEDKMMSAEDVAHRIVRGICLRKRELLMDFNGRATKLIKKIWPSLLDRLFYNHMAKEPDSPFK
ncbi:MAG: SDR family oxidoreductase [Rikenellaceae bacterium]|nr:SDR family oxidoreductase [Rikenellaceae bacterium]MDE7356456.1 SDR family oxidoreductase [Rikenellaceae bacterium]